MTTRTLLAAGILLGVPALVACTPQSHAREAEELRDRLLGLDGVDTVFLEYEEPIALDAADVDLDVYMDDAATAEEVAGVVEAAYEGLTDVHAEEEGNLVVNAGDDRLTLRTFESEADGADVHEAALVGAEVAAEHRTFVSLMAQDVEEAPHVETWLTVRLPKVASAAKGDRVRAEVEETYDAAGLEVSIRISRH